MTRVLSRIPCIDYAKPTSKYVLVGCSWALIVLVAGCSKDPPKYVDPAIVDAVQSRQSNYREMGAAFKAIQDALKSGAPLDATLVRAAREVNVYAGQQRYLFEPGTGPDSGVKTSARKEIWEHPEEFARLRDQLVAETPKLLNAASAGALNAFRAQASTVGKICASCHKKFREKKD